MTTTVSVKKKPPTGMTTAQRRIAEKAIRARYGQLDRAMRVAMGGIESTTVTMPESYRVSAYLTREDIDNPFKGDKKLTEEAAAIRKQVAKFMAKVEQIRNAQEAKQKQLSAKHRELSRRMEDDRDEAIIRVNFNGQSDNMLEFLNSLPTVDMLGSTMKSIGLPVPQESIRKMLECA